MAAQPPSWTYYNLYYLWNDLTEFHEILQVVRRVKAIVYIIRVKRCDQMHFLDRCNQIHFCDRCDHMYFRIHLVTQSE